ncbi:hypothetical protein ACFL5V_04565 [Fibrobacterota bacterium]
MSSQAYVFLISLALINPIILAYTFRNIYTRLKKKKVMKKLGKTKTAAFFALLAVIAVLYFFLVYLITAETYVLCFLIYAITVYFILEKSSKILLKIIS